jgi:hypothetical protein
MISLSKKGGNMSARYTQYAMESALETLAHHNHTPESLLRLIGNFPEKIITFTDSNKEVWSFVSRRRCRLFLLAKTANMKKYEDIYCSSSL